MIETSPQRSIVVAAALTGLLFATQKDAVSAQSVVWRSDFQGAWEEANKLDKPVLLHFYADWCGPCQQMEHNVLNNKDLLDQVGSSFVAIKINTDRHPELVSRFGVQALPTDMFVDPDGTVLSQSEGYTDLSAYLVRLTRIESDFTRSRKMRIVSQGTDKKPPIVQEPKETSNPAPDESVAKTEPKAASSDGTSTRPQETEQGTPRIGLGGFCPVTINEQRKWRKGSPKFAREYQGVVYHLASAKNLAEFTRYPMKFAPRLLGCDPVIMWETDQAKIGSVDFAAYFDGELFLFADLQSREAFRKNPVRYTRIRHVLRDDTPGGARIR
jgi:thiol-disulfide isomerase/thioredoxin/YHS domain-containing protein